MDFMSLPVDMIEHILSFLSYDEIAKSRIVSKTFNEICMRMLNRGFMMTERRHIQALKHVKAQLPRRESERRYHQLSRHCDILTSIETRLSMLIMTYSKFVDQNLCCFIPGKVLDEIRRVLAIVETEQTPPRPHEVLQELRDISSMAIEHFDDKISPALRRKLQEGAQPQPRPQQVVASPLVMRQDLKQLRRGSALNTKLSLILASQYKGICKQMLEYKKAAFRQRGLIRAMVKRQKDQEATIADLKKRIEECDIKYSELTHTNQAVGGKSAASKSPDVTSQQPLRHFSSQIKLDLSELPIGTSRRNSANAARPNIQPRKPVIRLPSLSEAEGEPPKKIAKTDPTPSTSQSQVAKSQKSSPKTKLQSTVAKIRDIANEIGHLTKEYDGKWKLKRKMTIDGHECKKIKFD